MVVELRPPFQTTSDGFPIAEVLHAQVGGSGVRGVRWLLLAGSSSAQDEECRAVIAKAMKAVGGEDKLAKIKAVQTKSKGVLSVMGMIYRCGEGVSYNLPQRVRWATV